MQSSGIRNHLPNQSGLTDDPKVIEHWRQCFPSIASYVEADALEFLTRTNFIGDEVVYCDPPYLPECRRSRVYRYDYDKHDHERLLEIVRLLPCKVLVSGYPSQLYDVQLREWNTRTFPAKTHSGVRLEQLWFNYDPPKCLHDTRYLGADFRKRQNFRRRADQAKTTHLVSLVPRTTFPVRMAYRTAFWRLNMPVFYYFERRTNNAT